MEGPGIRATKKRQIKTKKKGTNDPAATHPRDSSEPARHQALPKNLQRDLFEHMAEEELLKELLRHVIAPLQAERLARALVGKYGTFADVIAGSSTELRVMAGVTPDVLALLRCIHEASGRLAKASLQDKPIFSTMDQLKKYLNIVMSRDKVESCRVLFLDSKNRLISDEVIIRGDPNEVMLSTRQVLIRALELFSTAMILVHNHPSGDPKPSSRDIEYTKELKVVAKFLGIALHDHIIIGRGIYTSMRTEGLL